MRTIFTLLFICACFIFKAQSHEKVIHDTINMVDANGKKQGMWILFGRTKPGKCYQPGQVIEEGKYKDNKRIGVWKEYFCNSNMKSSITYVNGHPEGPSTFYYENGSLKETGTWKQNRWTGHYKSVDEAGNTTEIEFDEKGKEISKKITPVVKKK